MSRLVVALASLCSVSIVACSKPDAAETTASDGSKATQVGQIDISIDPLDKLHLSESLSPSVPASVVATGTGLTAGQVAVATLTDRKKSREACNIRQKIREAKMNQEGIAMQLCYLEAQRGMKAGGKYKMTFAPPAGAMGLQGPGGPGDPNDAGPPMDPNAQGGAGAPPDGQGMDPTASAPTPPTDAGGPGGGSGLTLSVFLDDSVKDQFTVFMCDSDKLTQKITLSGAGEKGAKGSFASSSSADGFDVQILGAFDNGVALAGHQRTISQMAFSIDMNGNSTDMRSNMNLDLVDGGVSTIKVASETANSSGDFSASQREIGTALIGPNLGSALFQRTVDGSNKDANTAPPMTLTGDQQVETSRTFFDSAGQTVLETDSVSFATGGVLAVTDAMFPKLLPTDFKVNFASNDWDCSGTETFDMDTESSAFKGCMDKFAASFSTESCDDDLYVVGMQQSDIPPAVDQRDPEGVPQFEPPPPAP